MLTVQSSSGLYRAVQYDGTNGQAISAALEAVDYSNIAGVLSFRSFIMRAGGLLTSGHRFRMALGEWIVWVDDVNPYVVGGPMPTEAFEQQYQPFASAADVTALQVQVADLVLQVVALDARVDTLDVTMGAVVATVNIHTGQINSLNTNVTTLDNDITALEIVVGGKSNVGHTHAGPDVVSGVLPYQRLAGTIAENATVVLYNRPTLVTPGTASDSWQWQYNGNRTVYGNEYNCLRARGIPDDQVVVRFMSNFARDGLATAIMQASLSNATSHLFQVLGNGDILSVGGLSMLPTAPVAVTFNAAGAANAGTITDGAAGSGAPYPVTTTLEASNNRVHLDGSMTNSSGVAITAQTTLFTVAAAHRPTAWTQFTVRTSSNLACRVTVKGATGAVCLDQQLAAGVTVSFDGANWRKS